MAGGLAEQYAGIAITQRAVKSFVAIILATPALASAAAAAAAAAAACADIGRYK